MNIKDVKDKKIEKDMLVSIFERQEELENKYKIIERENGFYVPEGIINIDDKKDQVYIKERTHRIIEELEEAMNCLKNKKWCKTHKETDTEHFFEELADALHFYVALMLDLGLTAYDVYNLYFKKSEVNKFRQRSGY
ncbi:MAG: dUTP diphosphatase [Candidatus Hodarchaeota archaeon]